MELRFKKSESFSIREGWFQKAINAIKQKGISVFSKNNGIAVLGIGSNMVKGLKYWLQASHILDKKGEKLTEDFGELLFANDRYLDSPFSWFLIHFNLVKNKQDCPIFNLVFNSGMKKFTRSDLLVYLKDAIKAEEPTANEKYIEEDLSVFLRSYINEDPLSNPEDNYACPLSELGLMKKDSKEYRLTRPTYRSLSYLIVFYALESLFTNDSFDIEEAIKGKDSPMRLFNLDKAAFLQYLEEMRHEGLITINKTAGLNTVYFERRLTLPEVFKQYFGGKADVQ